MSVRGTKAVRHSAQRIANKIRKMQYDYFPGLNTSQKRLWC